MKLNNTKELFWGARSGDNAALEKLVCGNIRLVHSIAGRFLGRGAEADDLFQIGSIGLVKAIYGFDTEQGVAFSTYAVPMIMGEIRRYLRDDGMVKVSRRLKEIAIKAKYLRDELEGSLSRDPTVTELSAVLGISCEELATAVDASLPVDSIYRPLGDDGSSLLMDKIAADEDISERITSKLMLQDVLNEMEPKERRVIYYRYYEDKKQGEIADILGISQVQVSRIEKKALCTMKEKLRPMPHGNI